MFEGAKVAVVIPCYDEGHLIARVIETMPDFVDRLYVVDDKSGDDTAQIIQRFAEADPERIQFIAHQVNQGVGGAIASGYKAALGDRIDVTVVMAGDGQMDPDDLPAIVAPVARGECDYAKGNRLFTGDAWYIIPRVRYLGNSMISLLTKIASGYWHVADSQSGYTAIGLKALQTIDWDKMYKRYGQPNDLLVRLNIHSFRVRDITIRPVYNVGERSGIKPLRMIPQLSWLMFRLFLYRMGMKYVIRDFHPLLFFYAIGMVLFPGGVVFGVYLILVRMFSGPVAGTSAIFAALMVLSGLQFLLFAMWFDMDHNKSLK